MHCGTDLQTGKALKTKKGAESADGTPINTRAIRLVSRGIRMVFLGLILTMLAVLLARFMASGSLSAAWAPYVVIGLIAGPLNTVVGPLLCLAVPKQTGTRPFIYTSAALLLVATAFNVTASLGQGLVFGILAKLAYFAGVITFAVFLQQLAVYMGEIALADEADSVIRAGIGLVIAFVALMIPLIGCLALLFYLAGLAYFFFRYAMLLWGMQSVVRKWGTV